MEKILQLLRTSSLTKTQKSIADYILDHTDEACFMTSTALAEKAGTSEASIIRFSRALGFTGYPDFQKELRTGYQNRISDMQESITVPAEKLIRVEEENSTEKINVHQYLESLENMRKAFTDNTLADIEKAADIILSTETKYIASTRSNAALGDYFHLYLKQMMPGVVNTNLASTSPIDLLCTIDNKDCLIIFSLPRYSSVDKLTAQMAKDTGAKIIVITDKPSSELAKYGDICLYAPVDISAFFNSILGPQFISELLLSVVSRRIKGLGDRLTKIDQYLNQLGNY